MSTPVASRTGMLASPAAGPAASASGVTTPQRSSGAGRPTNSGGPTANGPSPGGAPLVKAHTSLDHTELMRDSLVRASNDGSVSTVSTGNIAQLHTSSAPFIGSTTPQNSETKPLEPLGPLPSFPAGGDGRSPLKRPAPRPTRASPFNSQTLGRSRKEITRIGTLRNVPGITLQRRQRSKSVPGFPSWLLQRRGNMNSSRPELSSGNLAINQHGTPSSKKTGSSAGDDSDDSDTDSSCSSDDDMTSPRLMSPKTRSSSLASPASSQGSIESPPSLASPRNNNFKPISPRRTPVVTSIGAPASPVTATTTTSPSPPAPNTLSKDAITGATTKDKSSKSKTSSSKPKKKKMDDIALETGSSDSVSSRDNISGRRSFASNNGSSSAGARGGRPKQTFVTAFDWLKSYAAGQVELGDDEESDHESTKRSPAKDDGYGSSYNTNTGTGSGDEEEFDEEELLLISDTDDVSASIDREMLDSSSGTLTPMLMRRPVFKQLSTGLSTSSSSATFNTGTQGSKALSASEMEMDDSSGSMSTSGTRINKALLALSKGGSALGHEHFRERSADDSSSNSTSRSKSKRKTDRPPSRHRSPEDEHSKISDSSDTSSLALPLESLERSGGKRNPTKRNSERRMKDSPKSDSLAPTSLSARDPPTPTSPVDSRVTAAKPKFNRAATAAEGPTLVVTPTFARSKTSNSDEMLSPTSAHPKQPSRRDSGLLQKQAKRMSLSPNGAPSWKKTPDVVKLRKKTENGSGKDSATAGENNHSSPKSSSEFEHDGVLYGVHAADGQKSIHAITLAKVFEKIFDSSGAERFLRDEVLSLIPFLGKPADIIEALGAFWDTEIDAIKAKGTLPTSARSSKSNGEGAGAPASAKASSAAGTLYSAGSPGYFDALSLQQRLIAFITEWVRNNFTYFTDVTVLEALYRLLDRITIIETDTLSSQPSTHVLNGGGMKRAGAISTSPAGASIKITPDTAIGAPAPSQPKLPALKLGGLRQESHGAGSASASTSLESSTGSNGGQEQWLERDLLTRIIQYKLAGIDPRDLAGLVVRMQHPKLGLPTLATLPTAKGTYHTFVGVDAINWIKKMQDDTIDSMQAAFFKRLMQAAAKSKKVAAAASASSDKTPSLNASGAVPPSLGSARSNGGSGISLTASGNIPVHVTASGPGTPLARDSSLANVLEIDSSEVLEQLLKDGLITKVSASGKVRDPKSAKERSASTPGLQKKRIYAITVADHIEANAKLTNLELLSKGVPKPCGEPITPRSGGHHHHSDHGGNALFLQIQPDTFARQLTLMESKLFQRIEIHELHFWMKGEKERRDQAAPHLKRAIENTNRISSWVATEIVTTANEKQRVSTIKRFILVAQYCLKYRNYQGLLEIIGGLKNTSVTRLARTWAKLPTKYSDMLQTLSNIVDPDQNWKNYRRTIEAEKGACVPYFGLFLSDLTFIFDHGPMKQEDGRINWKKADQLSAIVSSVKKLQRRAYAFGPDFEILQFIADDIAVLDDGELFKRSKVLEASRARSGSIV